MPSAPFLVSFIIRPSSSSSNNAYLQIGSDTNNCILLGTVGNGKQYNLLVRKNNSYATDIKNGTISANTDNECILKYENNTLNVNNGLLTASDEGLTLSTLINCIINSNSIKNIKIKPL